MSSTETDTRQLAGVQAAPLPTEEIRALDKAHVMHPWRRQRDRSPIVVAGGEGAYFIDAEGKRWLDFHSGWGHLTLGYQPAAVIEAAIAQLRTLANVTPGFAHEPAARLGALLAELTPPGLTKSFFSTSGTDAVDIAVKIARAYTGKQKIIARYRSYHGNNYGAGVLSGDPRRLPLEPGMPGVVHAMDCYCYRCPFKLQYPSCDVHCADHIGQVIELEGPETVAAVIAEPVVASNGGLVPPPEYWPRLRALCDRYGVLLIADEIVTGFGRTGRWFACNHWDVSPDILVLAKGLSAGIMPLGATVVRQEIAAALEDLYLDAGLTYQSHPVSCAAAIAAIETLRDDGLIEHAERMGAQLKAGLLELQARHPSVGDVRALGLYGTLELVQNRATRRELIPWATVDTPNPIAPAMNRCLAERGVRTALRRNRLAVAPPLVIDAAGIAEGLAAIDAALDIADQYVTE